MSINAVMIIKNESSVLSRCIGSLQGKVDEVIVVDTGSTDGSREIAASFGAKVFDYPWNDHFADARNFALSKSEAEWNLVLDADEWVISWETDELREFMKAREAVGVVTIKDKFIEEAGNQTYHSHNSRLLPKGCTYQGRIHEQVVSPLPRRKVPIFLGHDGYTNITKGRETRNLKLLQLELEQKANDPYLLYHLSKVYRGKGKHEDAAVSIMSAYRFCGRSAGYYPNLVVDLLYMLIKTGDFSAGLTVIEENRDRLSAFPDFHFVNGLFYMDFILSDPGTYAHLLPEIEKAYLSCIEAGESEIYNSVAGTGSYAAYYNLGTYYETTGQTSKALTAYRKAAEYDYKPAISRLKNIGN